MEDRGFMKYLPIALVALLTAFGIAQLLRRQRKPRSFRVTFLASKDVTLFWTSERRLEASAA